MPMKKRTSEVMARDMSMQRKLSLHLLDANKLAINDRLADGYCRLANTHLGDKKMYRISAMF